ncbi:helix-turn-helix domain-containing protein [Natrinema sp. DC36]|uniref:helix-turn-helix domain-containing protein n=1 Tax=Natrinema sp. DC36 TaxID=2878680 RepID=UPI001CF08084|nr:helix-turn-helix domain-containing protein [Natrinema sp. DC36]
MMFEVVLCGQCENPWIVDEHDRRVQDSISCPNCPNEVTSPKVVTRQETKEAAAEARAQYIANEAGALDVYQRFTEDRGQYGKQLEEVERQMQQFPVDADLMDLKPIGSEKFEAFVDDHPIDADRFGDLVDDRPFYADAFSGEVSDDTQGDIGRELITDDLEEWVGEIDVDALPRGEVTPTNQAQISETVEIGDEPVSDVWSRVFEIDRVKKAYADGLEAAFGEMDVVDVYDVLEERSIPFWIRSDIVAIARDDHEAAEEFADTLTRLPETPLTKTEHLLATAALAATFETTVAVSVSFAEIFLERDRRDAEPICDLLAILAAGLDVRIVGTGRELSLLADKYRGDLPGVSEIRNRHRDTSWVDDVVSHAVDVLDPDGRHVEMLGQLAREPGGIMDRADLEALHDDIGRTRRAQILTSQAVDDSLEQLQLIEVFGSRGSQQVELLEPGCEVLDTLASEDGQQQTLEGSVSGTGNSSQQWRRTPRTRGGGRTGRPYITTYLGHEEHAAAAAAAESGTVTFVTGSLPDADATADYRERPVSYLEERDEAIVAPKASTPMEYTVTTALALADEKLFLDKALPAERIAEIDEPTHVLNAARQIGPVTSDSLDDPEELRSDLVEWGEAILGMIDRLKSGDFEDRDDLCSAILTSAKGLEGSIVHLLDAAGIEIIREVRVTPDLEDDKLDDLARSLAISASISSQYGRYAAYRQLFDVPNSTPPLGGPIADASDPVGELIGSFVIRGPDAHRLRDDLEYYLEHPRELLDNPAQFQVKIPVTEPDRDAYQEVAPRLLYRKRLRSTPAAISMFHSLVATPYDLAEALLSLPREDETRDLRADDVRFVLQQLSPDAILPDCGDAGKIIAALLDVDEPITQKELADRAGVRARTVRNHRNRLQGLGLLEITDDGYRLALSFRTPEERQSEVYPEIVATDEILIVEAADAVLEDLLPPDRYGDPDDPAGGVLFWPPDPLQLLVMDDVGPWITAAAALDDVDAELVEPTTVTMGPTTLAQQPLPTPDDSSEVGA